jgi:hypothetical protein
VQAFELQLTAELFARYPTASQSMRVGAFAHAIAWLRQRDHLSAMERTEFGRGFRIVLRRAIVQTL